MDIYKYESTKFFMETYDKETALQLRNLYGKRFNKRGISFYEPWNADYKAFAEYLIAIPHFDRWPEYEIDRIDNTKGYEPGNLRFVPRRANMRNRADTVFCEFENKKLPRMDFIETILGPEYQKSKIAKRIINHLNVGKRPDEIIEILKSYKFWDHEPVRKHFFDWLAGRFWP